MSNRNRSVRRQPKTFMATIDGKSVPVMPSGIKKDDWTVHHGKTAAGAQVNSLQSTQVGDLTMIKNTDGSIAAYKTNDLEVLSTQFLATRGQKVVPINA